MSEQIDEDLRQSNTPDARFADALKPAVEVALRRTIRDDPHTWAEALFPVLMPAIRMAVTSALRAMVQTLNEALVQSLSLRSWRWRVEAWRTGRSFAEVVLLRTLVYRVEQVLLLDRHTGLLLESVAASDVTPKDADLISGMLSAIQEFVHDSFEVEKRTGIHELHVADFSLWVEQGSQAALAAAVRGNAPVELRDTLRAAIDLVHQEFGVELRNFRGDAQPFARCRTILEGCLQSRYQAAAKRSYWRLWLCTAGVAAALIFWAGLRIQQTRRWERAVAALGEAPGIAITQARQAGGVYVVEGLRDPLAASPEQVLASNGLDPSKVSTRFRPFLSLDPKLLMGRARTALQAPGSVFLSLDRDVLKLDGTASHSWILQARNAGRQLSLAGIRDVRTDGLTDSDLEALRVEIEARSILFHLGSSVITPEQAQVGRAMAAKAQQWVSGALAIGRTPKLVAIGYTDRSGAEARNLGLSQERAEHVTEILLAAGIPGESITALGRGSESVPPETTVDPALHRKVVLRLSFGPHEEAKAEH